MKKQTISARVDVRTRRLAEAAADLRDLSLSAFSAEAIEESATRVLLGRRTPDWRPSLQDNELGAPADRVAI